MLRAKGLRLTPSRARIVDAVLGVPGEFTIERVRPLVPGAGRATVFRTIRLLHELGVVCRVPMEDGRPLYRLAGEGHHHHLVCSACGRVQEITRCGLGSSMEELARNTGYVIDSHRLEVYGTCPTCVDGVV